MKKWTEDDDGYLHSPTGGCFDAGHAVDLLNEEHAKNVKLRKALRKKQPIKRKNKKLEKARALLAQLVLKGTA